MSFFELMLVLLFVIPGHLQAAEPEREPENLESCLGQETLASIRSQLREMVILSEQNAVMDSALKSSIYSARVRKLNRDLLSLKSADTALKCLGLKVKWKTRIALEDRRAVRNSLLLSYLLLDESMLPRVLSDLDLSPPVFRGRVSHVTKVKNSFFFTRGAAGVYWPPSRKIGYIDRWVANGWALASSIDQVEFALPEEEAGGELYTIGGDTPFTHCSPSHGGASRVILHEYGHSIDHALAGYFTFYSSGATWKKIKAHREVESPYGQTSDAEDFAESFASYLLQPLFKCYAPAKYELFSSFVLVSQDVYGSRLPYEGVNCTDPLIQFLMELRTEWVARAAERCKK
ncbi:MAG TPA: hypothetical protein DCS07_06905 [Bdellovibrionales bacterium]|nr:MAG: hypothetical protein A2X97_08240 [Bdellovibrionales bacterium GWA1_52_35]OFZ43912.1 MAG: hypothetical protein A2070_14135 [Bdellovibrionales bacterium GWC1_52_8]HAR42348.1 hypothetical protein [Bdellovibrionales bacterium]HCM41491.1 hypothetical protein [Bdellovibrionales bacterium]